jgi:anti-anti-sigma factor
MLTKVHGERHVIVLGGELDIASAQILEDALAEACSAGAKELVIDMAGVEFMDSTGLRAILRGKTLCEEQQCAYRLTPAQHPVERTLELTGLPRSRLRLRRPAKRPTSTRHRPVSE